MKKGILALMLLAGTSISVCARPTVLTLKESIQDSTIVYPESFETDTHKLMQNWYLQNYAVIDGGGDAQADVPATKEDYIQRLSALPTVIEMPYNQIVRSYIDMYTQRRRTLVEEMLGLSLYYMPIFEQALEKEGMPLELKYLPVIESALNPDAVSRVGATGLWQFMLGTAKGLGLEVNTLIDERRDPIRSSEMAAKYLKQLYGIYGDWSLAIASYNCGPGNVNKALRRAGGGKKDFWEIYYYLPAETRGYVPAFIAANYVMAYYKDHNIGTALARRPVLTDTIHVNKRVHFNQISEILNIPVEELRVLNPQYRRDEIPGDIRPYALTLPSKQVYSYIVSEDSIVSHNALLYSRRTEVQPTDESQAGGTKLVVKYHKVRKGETISKVARAYGVTTTQIKKWNNLRSNRLRRGQKLRINTYERVEPEEEEAPAEEKESMAEAVPETRQDTAFVEEQDENSGNETAVSGSERYHTVKSGDTLGNIAERYGVTVSQLKSWNNLRSNQINIGQRLKLFASADNNGYRQEESHRKTTRHKVKKGESLSSIADDYGVTIDDLKEWNNLTGNSINAGQTLVVRAEAAKKTATIAAGTTTHTVKSGDTLGKIADRYGVTVAQLKDWNGLASNDIKVGQKLKVSGKPGQSNQRKDSTAKQTTHTVKRGDTLGSIAERYGTTVAAIRRANGIKGSNIRAGQRLKIPVKK